MKTKLNLFFVVILVLFLGATNISADETNLFGRQKSISFKGENQNWLVVHQMYLVGTEIEYDTKIRYKGNNVKLKNLSSLHYSIGDKDGYLGGTFSLKNSNVFHSGRMECYGCKYLDKKEEITFIIGEWEDYEESLTLKRE
ncbi:hypothetical protein [Halalkalibacter alkalisediminis]|uniref:Uncharacterized protein n=1 Tax=Halalkalibacter alkalisediminis TaxID=935616 RepID=A0ABV6NET5_9BACI|nr:hypothetical protein [Halalkalibacter alkalisediminis]